MTLALLPVGASPPEWLVMAMDWCLLIVLVFRRELSTIAALADLAWSNRRELLVLWRFDAQLWWLVTKLRVRRIARRMYPRGYTRRPWRR